MASSKQLTARVNSYPNPEQAEAEVFKKARYLVAQFAPSGDNETTNTGYFHGRHVIPAPLADPEIFPVRLYTHDLPTLKHKHYIRFTDNVTTTNADESVGQAIYTIMTDGEANEFERELRRQLGISTNKKKKVDGS